jgi:hypothetical protein
LGVAYGVKLGMKEGIKEGSEDCHQDGFKDGSDNSSLLGKTLGIIWFQPTNDSGQDFEQLDFPPEELCKIDKTRDRL